MKSFVNTEDTDHNKIYRTSSPSPVATAAPASPSQYSPEPMSGESPTLPGNLKRQLHINCLLLFFLLIQALNSQILTQMLKCRLLIYHVDLNILAQLYREIHQDYLDIYLFRLSIVPTPL